MSALPPKADIRGRGGWHAGFEGGICAAHQPRGPDRSQFGSRIFLIRGSDLRAPDFFCTFVLVILIES
jgi:hypothetical protein